MHAARHAIVSTRPHLLGCAHDEDGHKEDETRAQEVKHDCPQAVASQKGHEEAKACVCVQAG
jgi:hypothetical protein